MTPLPLAAIQVRPGRRRVDPAKAAEIARSIAEVGLLNPITVDAQSFLIAGAHRIEAHRLLGLDRIEATVLPLRGLAAELAEIDENLIRNDLTTLERAEQLARRKTVYEALHPEAPSGAGRPQKNAERISAFTDDTAAKTGVTARTVRQEVQIATAIVPEVRDALRETPIADAKTDLLRLARMAPDQQRQVAHSITTGQARTVPQAAALLREAERVSRPLPPDKYRVLYADPPWRYDNGGFDEAAEAQYPTLDVADICILPVAALADEGSVLFLWATNPLLPEALQVLAAWGFSYKTNLAWIKDQGRGKGWFLRSKHELLLIGTRSQTSHPQVRPDSCFEADRGAVHSRKPARAYELIEQMYAGPRIELFARARRPGWDAWGDEPAL